MLMLAGACAPAAAQGWWPWDNEPQRPPVPQEGVYERPQPPPQQAPAPAEQPAPSWSDNKSPICLQLEQRLVQDGNRGSQTRDALPRVEADMRAAQGTYQQAERQLERGDCYDYFLFSKTLRRTRACVDAARQSDEAKRRYSELSTERQSLMTSAGRSYRDDIISELARNNCGSNYAEQARRRGPQSEGSVWEDEGSGSSSNWGRFNGGNGSTYRTVCVRLCDGYYFPVSFSTLPSHFEQDKEVCQSKCSAPAELYFYQNPGGAVEDMVAVSNQEPYKQLKTAFRYRKELVQGCSCKEAEQTPQTPIPEGQLGKDKRTDAAPAPGAAPPAPVAAAIPEDGWQPR